LIVKYQTLALSQQVLERQRGHATEVGGYLRANADIGDSTGFLLAAFKPLSEYAVTVAGYAVDTLGHIDTASAAAVGDTAVDFAKQDAAVGEMFSRTMARLGSVASGPSGYPDLGGPSLGPAGSTAPDDYGDVSSYLWEKAQATGESLGGAVGDAQDLIEQVGHWGGAAKVGELVDPSSFLVSPQSPENVVQDLRWSAGAILGSIDWVAERVLGYSILDRCIFQPFAGDWEGIFKASQAWQHAGSAAYAIGRNHAGLVAATPATWQGLSGNSFRGTMTTTCGAALGLQAAFEGASGLVKTISTVCKLACTGIGMALNTIVNLLLKKAAELATPVVGWAVGAATAYSDIEKIVKNVRLVYTIIETIASAIEDFAEAKTSIMDRYTILEDVLQGLGSSAVNA
jgi:hypothetical protein